ncbi:uncharacterized protein HD556DRAFT_1493348 [Suillus plorans]|uniref:Nuclear pore complex protein n=1 Tax=Suillus plorans TaxID=116603 RepID=A0A9P7AH99_9AGAM|nr:uncharacterized protein HD556DRAFT_1493348 [Suillus plorans]KAG1789417.1 hypothetical protein HD556DRAFT_1493348 [Suillus plorans]
MVDPGTLLAKNPYTHVNTTQAIMNSSVLLTELVVVREWFHETAPRVQHPETTTGYWKFMKHILCRLYAQTQESIIEGLVKELNPDAMNRKSEKILAQALYSFVRAGRLDEAVELCRKHINRGVLQVSAVPYFFSSELLQTSNGMTMESTCDIKPKDAKGWQGNPCRRLTCTRAALNMCYSNLLDAEHILYAALALCSQTSCRPWEDHLWVQIKHALTTSQEENAVEEEDYFPCADRQSVPPHPTSQLAIILDWTSSLLLQLDARMETSILNYQSTIRPPSTAHHRANCRRKAKSRSQSNTPPVLLCSHRIHQDEPRTPLSGENMSQPELELELDLESLGLEDQEIPPDKLTKLEKIGSGGFKDVFIGKFKGRWVATVEFRDQLNSMDIKELKLLGSFDHPNIVRFISIPSSTNGGKCMDK